MSSAPRSNDEEEKKRQFPSLHTVGLVAQPPPREPPKPLLRTLEVRMIEVNRLSDINIIGQRFRAEVVVQLAFVDGNLDDHLKNPSDAFPLDGFGRPTFRPSAAWYMAQVDFNNAHEYKTLDKKIVPDGNDLLMNFRFEGLFSEVMEMQDFPCDVQELTMSLCFNTRTTGMMPLEIVNAPSLQTGIIEEGFVDGMMWDLYRGLDSRPGAVGRTEDRMFPTLEMVMIVGRQPTFFLLNLWLPVFFFVPMAMLQFAVPRETVADRLSVSLAIVLTAVAHKYSMTSLVPAISYLTFLDKYVISSLLLIVVITFQGLIGSVEIFYCRTQAVWEEDNVTSVARRLASRTGLSDGMERVPLGYYDADCPPSKSGPFGKFDWIDTAFLLVDVMLWLILQGWSLVYFYHTRHSFDRMVAKIKESQEQKREIAEKSMRKGQHSNAPKPLAPPPPATILSKVGEAPAKPAAPKRALSRSKSDLIMARMPAKEMAPSSCDEVNDETERGGMQEQQREERPPMRFATSTTTPTRQAPSLSRWRAATPARVMVASSPQYAGGQGGGIAAIAHAARDRERSVTFAGADL